MKSAIQWFNEYSVGTQSFVEELAPNARNETTVLVSFASYSEAAVDPIPQGYMSVEALSAKWRRDPEKSKKLTEARQRIAGEFQHETGVDLRALRLAIGLSQAELATALNTSQPNIARLESGRNSNILLETLTALKDVLNVSYEVVIQALEGSALRSSKRD